MGAPYTASGKQVLHSVDCLNAHFADCINDQAAQQIADALNEFHWRKIPMPDDIQLKLIEHHIRQENDEMVCSCGLRWDVKEEHP
jgi:hypothetical protein